MKFSLITNFLALGATLAVTNPTAEPAALSDSSSPVHVEKRATLAQKKKATDQELFGYSLDNFLADRKKKSPSYLDWSSDGCTKSPDYPFKWPFIHGCYRHDFGYRNYKKQERFTRDNKRKIDDRFYNE